MSYDNYTFDSHRDIIKYLAVLMCYKEAIGEKKIG
tara:strand:+ start:423 stop:527 length:105 start_codon:yes stop_codon:yes gene_type:complete